MEPGKYLADLASKAGDAALEAAREVGAWTTETAKAAFADTLGTGMAVKNRVSDTASELAAVIRDGKNAVLEDLGAREPDPDPATEGLVQACPVDEPKRKQKTRQRRKKLIEEGKVSSDPAVRQSAERLERDMDAVEEAKLSNHIYCIHDPAECDCDSQEVPGFKNVSNDPETLARLGLKKSDLKTPDSNFRAALFARQDPPYSEDEAGYVVVFKGTTPNSGEDWRNNFRQGIDAGSPYYQRATRIANKVQEAAAESGTDVGFAGHSLGGGLASAAASAAGARGNTFNAAGLHAATVERYAGVPGDPLTETNINGVTVAGFKVSSPPLAAGQSQRVERALSDTAIPEGEGENYFHSMPVVIRAIERRKAADQETLRGTASGGPPP